MEEKGVGDLNITRAPWTERQVNNLYEWQMSSTVHPFTCPNRSREHHFTSQLGGHDIGILFPTRTGFECESCEHRQGWAHQMMTDPDLAAWPEAPIGCETCERCSWNPGPDCGRPDHPHCSLCGHCEGRHASH